MPGSRVQLVVFEGFADWQVALACHQLTRRDHLAVRTAALTMEPLRSASGLKVVPDGLIEQIRTDDTALLVLPGGSLWEGDEIPAVSALLREMRSAEVPIAAIGGATVALARAGLLVSTRHTSNGLHWLRSFCADYRDDAYYVAVPAVTEDGVITAAATGIIDFAYEIVKLLDLVDEPERRTWLRSFREGLLPVKNG